MERKDRIKYVINKIRSGESPKKHTNNQGYHYYRVTLGRGSTRKLYNVQAHHVLYCLYHGLEDIPEGYEINHKDFDRKNNSPENIELVTRKENLIHAWARNKEERQKHVKQLAKQTRAKLTEKEVSEIRDLLKSKFFKQYEIAGIYGVQPKQISKIKTGRAWNE